MLVRHFSAPDLQAVHQLLQASGWAHRVGSAEDLARLIAASQRTAVAVEAQQIIGFARAITDGISNGYLSMVVVAEPFRRQGVGQALIKHIVGEEESITWVLRAGREGVPEFFAKLGFVESTVAMELTRRDVFAD